MKKNWKMQPRRRLLKASCVGAGLLSISNPTQITAADIGLFDVHNNQSLGSIPNPFPNVPLGVHVAVGDVDGDGLGDIIMGPGSVAAEFAVALGKIFHKVDAKHASGLSSPGGGVRVATGDLDGDGIDEIVLTPAIGPGSEAVALKHKAVGEKEPQDYETIDATSALFDGYAGGVNVAIGDYEGDGVPDIVAARAGYGGSDICKWKQTFTTAIKVETPYLDSAGGLQVAMGNIDGDADGADEILISPNSSADGLAHAFVSDHKHKEWIEILSYTFNEPAGVHVALGDVDGDGRADLVVGSAFGYDSYIKLYSLKEDPLLMGAYQAKFKYDLPAYSPLFRGGVRVAVGDINGDGYADVAYAPAGVPEPATIVSLFTGLGAWLFGSRRRRRNESPG